MTESNKYDNQVIKKNQDQALHIVCMEGDIEGFKELAKDKDFMIRNINRPASCHDFNSLKQILQNTRYEHLWQILHPPLVLAILAGHDKVVELLLKQPDIDVKAPSKFRDGTEFENSPLYMAIYMFLISNENGFKKACNMILHRANKMQSNIEIIKLLMQHNRQDRKTGPLNNYVLRGDDISSKLMFLKDALNPDSASLLDALIIQDDPEILALILPYYHDISLFKELDTQDKDGQKPFDLVASQYIEQKKYVISKQINTKNVYKTTFEILFKYLKSNKIIRWVSSDLCTDNVCIAGIYCTAKYPENIQPIRPEKTSVLDKDNKALCHCYICHESFVSTQDANAEVVRLHCNCTDKPYAHILCLGKWHIKCKPSNNGKSPLTCLLCTGEI